MLEVYGSFVHVERLTLRNANRGAAFPDRAAQRATWCAACTPRDTRLGFGAREDQLDFYICDNLLEGRLVWPHVYTDDDGAHSNDDGILVEGNGHVVCHNQVVGFGDALKTEQAGARAVDFYGNEVLSAYDNGIELDLRRGQRCAACATASPTPSRRSASSPSTAGPAYAVRNVVVNVAHEQMKFHGIGSATGRAACSSTTTPSSARTSRCCWKPRSRRATSSTSATTSSSARPVLSGTRVADWLAPIDHGVFENDGWFPDGGFRFNLAPGGLVSFPTSRLCRAAASRRAGSC